MGKNRPGNCIMSREGRIGKRKGRGRGMGNWGSGKERRKGSEKGWKDMWGGGTGMGREGKLKEN